MANNEVVQKLRSTLMASEHGVVGRMVRAYWDDIRRLRDDGYSISSIYRAMKKHNLMVDCTENGFRAAVKRMPVGNSAPKVGRQENGGSKTDVGEVREAPKDVDKNKDVVFLSEVQKHEGRKGDKDFSNKDADINELV